MSALKYDRFNEARAHFKDLLDAASQGRAASVERKDHATALVDRDQFVHYLRVLNADRVRLVPDDIGWLAVVGNAPIAGEGKTSDEAVDDLIDALRDYADDWSDRLRLTPNHEGNWGLVQLVDHSSDDQLRGWINGVRA